MCGEYRAAKQRIRRGERAAPAQHQQHLVPPRLYPPPKKLYLTRLSTQGCRASLSLPCFSNRAPSFPVILSSARLIRDSNDPPEPDKKQHTNTPERGKILVVIDSHYSLVVVVVVLVLVVLVVVVVVNTKYNTTTNKNINETNSNRHKIKMVEIVQLQRKLIPAVTTTKNG